MKLTIFHKQITVIIAHMLELQKTIKSLIPDKFHQVENPPSIHLNKYKTPEEVQQIAYNLLPIHTILGQQLFHAPSFFEAENLSDHRSFPYIALTSELGEKLLQDEYFFTLLETDPSQFPSAKPVTNGCQSTTYRVPYKNKIFYVKIANRLGLEPSETAGMLLLEERGVNIAPIHITTQSRLVTEEAQGTQLTSQIIAEKNLQDLISIFRRNVNQIIAQLKNQNLWLNLNGSDYVSSLFEHRPDHFFIRNLGSENPLDWFTVIDAVTYLAPSPHYRFSR